MYDLFGPMLILAYPNAVPFEDWTLIDRNDGSGVRIENWNVASLGPQPEYGSLYAIYAVNASVALRTRQIYQRTEVRAREALGGFPITGLVRNPLLFKNAVNSADALVSVVNSIAADPGLTVEQKITAIFNVPLQP